MSANPIIRVTDKQKDKMETATVENDKSTGFEFANLAAAAAEGKMLVEDFVEIGKRKAQRLIRRGREAGEDCLDETTHYIKHNPWQSVATAAGVGALVGVFFGWTFFREQANRKRASPGKRVG